ncbi:MAG: PAS domain-containing protein [Leptolyngbya sp.]|nr:PAS domain-containing protein [Candidatus Melainabacteria bacterium]
MPDFWKSMTEGFMPHGYCLGWDGPLLFVFIVGNLGIAIAYFLIPLALRFFIGKRKDLPYGYMFKMFAAFILSCGITHIVKVVTLYQPVYWLEAGLDLWTAGVSLLTAFLLFPLIPKALSLRGPRELDEANSKLERSNAELELANKELLLAKEKLEDAVKTRTSDLEAAVKLAQEGEVQFRTLFEMMPQLGWTAQADGFIDFYNHGWYDYTGTTFEEMQGWGWEKVHDPTVLPVVMERWKESLSAGTAFLMDFPLRRKDGVFNTFATRVTPIFDQGGQLLRWVGINTNIQVHIDALEAVAESDRQFRHLAATLPDIVWIVDNHLQSSFLNERWYQYTGLVPPDGLGSKWQEILHPECLSKALHEWEIAIASKLPYESEQRLRAANGDYRWHLVRGIPIFDSQGAISRWFGTSTDIHEKRSYSDELEKAVVSRTADLLVARDEAIAANEAKSRFLATVSHEVRTPMAGVIGLVELIGQVATQDDVRSLSKSAFESCKRLLQILNNILDASKLQFGAVNLEYRFFSVRSVIGDVVQLVTPEVDKKSVKISSSVDSDIPDLICGDELRVRQILQNLVFNAVKFTEMGSVDIRVSLLERTSAGSVLKFSIVDTGIGVTEEQKHKLFQPFAQADDSTTRVYGGTGLGLHICKTLTDLMQGEIGVISQAGQGATFWVRIPFRDDLCLTE